MRISITGPGISAKRIRELADAHDRAWSQRARFLRQSTDISVPCEELTQKADAPLLALLAEGISEGQWVAAPRGECVLVEREGDELVLRRAPREMVEAAPECSGPKTVEKRAALAGRMRYRKAVVTTRRISGWVCVMCVLALGIFQAVGVLGLTLDSQSVLQAAVWCLIAALIALIVHLEARMMIPDPVEDVPDNEAGQYSGGWQE